MRALAILIALGMAAPAAAQDQYPYGEAITVIRYLLDVRVTDFGGKAIDDLKTDEFTVTIDGKPAQVESASWIPGGGSVPPPIERTELDPDSTAAAPIEPETPAPRWVVFFVQTDFGRASGRVNGQMQFNKVVDWFIEKFDPHDRVAVVSHDSQLKLRLDFTDDRNALRDAVVRSISIDRPKTPPAAAEGPSLVRLLDAESMARAATGEEALNLLAKAMHQIDGRKLLVSAGWGLGERVWRGRAVSLPREWVEAVTLLEHDHTPVIVLNTGVGGELTAGLKATAEATGGIHIYTQAFIQQGLERFGGALAGHYELAIHTDQPLRPGEHKLQVRVTRKGLTVHAPPTVLTTE